MSRLTLDQVTVFLAVVEKGSFLAAGRHLNRAQSAISYAIRALEVEVGAELFARGNYRASLTEAGRALLSDARRIADSVGAFETRAKAISGGDESEVSLVVDTIFPMSLVRDALRAFSQTFPGVRTRLHVEAHTETAPLLLDKTCSLGVVHLQAIERNRGRLVAQPSITVEVIPVVAPSHSLAAIASPVPVEDLQPFIRLLLGTRRAESEGATERLYGELWFVNDIAAKRELLLNGVGWGIMPLHMVEEDLCRGALKHLKPARWDYPPQADAARGSSTTQMYVAQRSGETLGRASQWLFDYLATAPQHMAIAAE